MPSPTRRTRAVLLLVVGLLASLVVAGTGSAAVAATDKGIVSGSITCPKLEKCPGLTLRQFDANWNYIGEKKLGVGARGYSVTLPAGNYWFQFVDQRADYDVTKYAPTDAKVTIAGSYTERNVRMQKGAAVTGTVRGGGKALGGATVRAANKAGQSFPTTANSKGQFAIGGLPQGQYSLFTWDKTKTWVGKSTWAGSVKPGRIKNLSIKLTKRAGDLTVYLTTPNNNLLKTKTTLTVTSKQTGQWWSVTSGTGTFAFRGLYPGGYTAQFNGASVWFAKTGSVSQANVVSNGFDTGEFHLTKRGGWLRGTVVDAANPDIALEGAVVELFDPYGTKLDSTTSAADGSFKLEGQLATRNDLTVVVQPGPYTDFMGVPSQRCEYARTEHGGVAVTTGAETAMGSVPIERKVDGTCNAPAAGNRSRISR